MTLPFRTKRILHHYLQWPSINVCMLNEGNITKLEILFKYLIEHDMIYTINDMDSWLKQHFEGNYKDTREHILSIAIDVLIPPVSSSNHGQELTCNE